MTYHWKTLTALISSKTSALPLFPEPDRDELLADLLRAFVETIPSTNRNPTTFMMLISIAIAATISAIYEWYACIIFDCFFMSLIRASLIVVFLIYILFLYCVQIPDMFSSRYRQGYCVFIRYCYSFSPTQKILMPNPDHRSNSCTTRPTTADGRHIISVATCRSHISC